MSQSFALTWDYRCPFARIVHEYVVTGLEAGADWDVSFRAFSLDQTHVEDGRPPVWEEPDRYPALLANLAGVVVRDQQPENFLAVHRALFSARHDEALDLRDRSVLAKVLDRAGVDADQVLDAATTDGPLRALAAEHSDAADRLQVFGVPTFIVGDRAVFVRLMERPGSDPAATTAAVDRVLDMISGWPALNEFKHTSLSN